MFERYTEKARRIIFFARYEASAFGSPAIETEHLFLLGLLREDKALVNRFLRSVASIESIRKQVEEHTPQGEKIPTSVDLPISHESKRALMFASEESKRLHHKHVGPDHLLLGLLVEGSFAAQLLTQFGLGLAHIREEIAKTTSEFIEPPSGPVVPTAAVAGLRDVMAAMSKRPGITVSAKPAVGNHAPDFAVYEGDAAETGGEIEALRRRIQLVRQRMENAIVAHEFDLAGGLSSEERELRASLKLKTTEQSGAAPFLCIEIIRNESLLELQSRTDDYLATGVSNVWLLSLLAKRAYIADRSGGLREFKGAVLRTEKPVVELELKQIY